MNWHDIDDPKPIKVKEPKDIEPPDLRPIDIEPVDVRKPDPPQMGGGFWFRLNVWWNILTKGADYELNELNKGEPPRLVPALINILSGNWKQIAIGICALIVIIVAMMRIL